MSLPTMIKLTSACVLSALLLALVTILSYFAGPALEAAAFPIMRAVTVAGSSTRDARCMCWTTWFEKNRTGTPVFFDYRIIHKERPIPVPAYKANTQPRVYLSTYAFANHASGEKWSSRYCIDLPGDVGPEDSFKVEGEAIYDVWHRLWRVRQPLPSFEVIPKAAAGLSRPAHSKRASN